MKTSRKSVVSTQNKFIRSNPVLNGFFIELKRKIHKESFKEVWLGISRVDQFMYIIHGGTWWYVAVRGGTSRYVTVHHGTSRFSGMASSLLL